MINVALTKVESTNLLYLIAAVLFIFGLMNLSSVKTSRRGNLLSAGGMLIAAVVTLFLVNEKVHPDQNFVVSFVWIFVALVIGTGAGLWLALKTPMTGMPQMVALLNGFGGIASLLVAWADYALKPGYVIRKISTTTETAAPPWPPLPFRPGSETITNVLTDLIPRQAHELFTIGLAVLIGGVTFTGSLVAFAKLQGGRFNKIVPDQPVQFPGQKIAIAAALLVCLLLTLVLTLSPGAGWTIPLTALIALALGVLLVIGIGGADMPVVISLLNSYSGLAAAMAGFVLNNECLIITGALVGASGIILTNIMCKAMNRSLVNVLFGGVGALAPASGASAAGEGKTAREFSVEDAAIILDAARQVVVVPGYGMAVAQAQHAVAELAELLQQRGITVKYAIHPVAGRMPGHMNVLLAEASVPYEQLCDLETINPQFEQTDVALIIGANDVTNPAARHDKSSPIYGMPILDVDKARTVIVIKRSLNPGFAGIQNELYFKDNCGMLFGDGKKMIVELIA